ncbi:alkaline phosphatase D family protein [Colwellia echini]|uniref:Twin-arginine translocation pathway signal n=1 Tax=Colwellia echini TaxID=1982103 RepID=A0ABY3N1B1_9GAMM|nr:alkaline phosphatase D family protein [Colwellia echini]TYK67199.1 twin-arginine translocation pathway signal [Colwellia echini]
MNNIISRRGALKFFGAGVGAGVLAASAGCSSALTKNSATSPKVKVPTKTQDNWSNTYDRVWLGGEFWASPMEDWRVKDGYAECVNPGGNRSIHSLTHQITQTNAPFNVSVRIENLKENDNDGGAGIRLGARSELNEYRSNCFVREGLDIGILKNKLMIGNESTVLSQNIGQQPVDLVLTATPQVGAMMLHADVRLVSTQKSLGNLSLLVSGDEIIGNIALVSNFALAPTDFQSDAVEHNGSRYRFSQWAMSGDAFENTPSQRFGPILWTMYTLSDSLNNEGFILKLTALIGPMGENDTKIAELQINRNNEWVSVATANIDPAASIASFRVTQWDERNQTPFRVVYNEAHKDGTTTADTYAGIIKANPIGRPMRMASLTCQNDYAFPYAPVVENLVNLEPDLAFFSGDQLYESHGGFGCVRAPADRAVLNYLRMYYQFGWSFRDAMRNQPTVCLPDDHDVLQGNLWGEGGAPMQHIERDPTASVLGGYIQPVSMINVVHQTNTAHHPDPYDATTTPSGISSYYGSMIYGDVGFAILADRQWKSGPERIGVDVGITGQDEAPEYINPDYDKPDLKLLGERQEAYLKVWGQDWRGHKLKAVLSQTVFAGIATHQPRPDRYLKYDFDCSGWPSSARNNAIDIMRDSMALHICGDTHLGTLSQYGVDQQRDSNWAFCSPAISAGWPRWWAPDSINLTYNNRPKHGLPNTGEYLDAFGNKMYVYAVANPVVGKSGNRYVQANEKGSGFGFITFDTEQGTYTMDAYKFLVDVTDNKPSNQFEGWPVTIHKEENSGKNRLS